MGMILMPGGGGGIDLDVVTADAKDIWEGKVIVGSDGDPITGTMPIIGKLNWSDVNTTKNLHEGYYSGGTLDSRPSFNSGYNSGVSAADDRVNTSSASYASGYASGRTQGQNDVKNSPNSYGLYTKTQYDANYNNGLPNTANLSAWYRDDTTAHTWTCGTAGYYLIFAYGFVNATRHVTPTVTCNGTSVAYTNNSVGDADQRYVWLYKMNSGNTVSVSWAENHGTYYWRNGFAIIRVK